VRTKAVRIRPRAAAALAAAVAITLLWAPAGRAEQAASQAKRLPAGHLASGSAHTCVILAGGSVRCWGSGADGRLGYGNTSSIGDDEHPDSIGPVNLGPGRKALALAAGAKHTCAILDTRRVSCWGAGDGGRLGYGNTAAIGDNETPGSAGTVDLGANRTALAIAAGDSHTCAILDTGAVRCWGLNSAGQLGYGHTSPIGDDEPPGAVAPVSLGPGRKAVAIATGGFHTCAILDTGAVRCWGFAVFGQLGYGNTDPIGNDEHPASVTPVDLGANRKAVAIAAGYSHTCTILDTRAVRCWGRGTDGELGLGNTSWIGDDETPGGFPTVNVGAGRKAVAIAVGAAHTCAILDTGAVRCWGAGFDGQLGYGNTARIGDDEPPASVGPVNVGAGRKVIAVGGGDHQTCALLDTGRVRCWGQGGGGQLGYPNTGKVGDDEHPAAAGPVQAGGIVPTKIAPTLSSKLAPARDRTAPYNAKVSGVLAGFPVDGATCSGTVLVTAKKDGKAVTKRTKLVRAGKRCAYSATLRVSGAGIWKVTARFAGNGSLAARAAPARSFRAG
jgi:alpha-tubulin suppressor-like RCC1 family protein